LPEILREIVETLATNLVASPDFRVFVKDILLATIKQPANGKDGRDGRTPLKGKDYLTDSDVKTLIALVEKGIRIPQDGADGKDGKPGAPGKDGSPDTGAEIVGKINALPIKPEFQIDVKRIKGIENVRKGAKFGAVHRGGLKLVWDTELEGTVNGVNTVFTVPAGLPDPKDDKFIVSARGVLKTVDAGDFTVSNSNRTLTFASAPPNGSTAPRIILYHGK
jgi:hypothetical protein